MPAHADSALRHGPGRFIRACAVCTLIGLAWAGCAGSGAAERERDDLGLPSATEVAAPATPEAEGAFVGPPVPEVESTRRRPGRDSDRLAAAPESPGEPADADGAAPAGVGNETGGGLFRADGRPTWWLDAPERGGGRVSVTGEGLGADQTGARESALRAARDALGRAIGMEPAGERVESFLARRLPGDAPGRARFVSYVRLSARDPEAPHS